MFQILCEYLKKLSMSAGEDFYKSEWQPLRAQKIFMSFWQYHGLLVAIESASTDTVTKIDAWWSILNVPKLHF